MHLWQTLHFTHRLSLYFTDPALLTLPHYTFSLTADCLWWWNGCGRGWSFYLLLWRTSDLCPTNNIDMLCATSRSPRFTFSSVTPLGSLVHLSLFCSPKISMLICSILLPCLAYIMKYASLLCVHIVMYLLYWTQQGRHLLLMNSLKVYLSIKLPWKDRGGFSLSLSYHILVVSILPVHSF